MTITKSEIITFWNQARKGSLAVTATTLDVAIQLCLNDLSNSNFLKSSDTTQTLTSTSTTLAYPALYKDLMDGGIILNDGSFDLEPLTRISWRDYRNLMTSFNSGLRSTPKVYAEQNKLFYLYAPPGQAYTTTIWYFKYHAQNVAAIEFEEEFRNAVYFGTTFFKSQLQGNQKYMGIWLPIYEREKQMRRMCQYQQPAIVKG